MLIVHLFVSYAHVNHCFSSSWCQGLAATSAVALPGRFCLPFFYSSYHHCYLSYVKVILDFIYVHIVLYMFSCFILSFYMFRGSHGRLATKAKYVTLFKHCINK